MLRRCPLRRLHLLSLLLMSLARSSNLLLAHVGGPGVRLRGRWSSRSSGRVALAWAWALGWLSACASRLDTTPSGWEDCPDILGHEGRGWLLEYLLKLLMGEVEPVLEAGDLWLLM